MKRSTAWAVLTTVAAAGLGLAVAAAPAGAAGLGYEFAAPAADTTLDGTGGTTLAVQISCPLGLCVGTPPKLAAGDAYSTAANCSIPVALAAKGSSLVGSLDLLHLYPTSCAGLGGRPAADGTLTLTLSGNASGTRQVTLGLPPATPAAPTVTAVQGGIHVSFPAPAEPDASGNVITVDAGQPGQVQGQIPCASGASTCEQDIGLPAGTHAVTLTTLRGSNHLTGAASPAATVTVAPYATAAAGSAAAATPPATKAASPAGGKAAPSASISHGTLPSSAASAFGTGSAATPSTLLYGLAPGTLPNLPTVATPAVAPAATAAPTPASEGIDGPFQSAIPYGSAAPEVTTQTTPINPVATAPDTLRSSADSTPIQKWGSIAGALLLALTAGHVRYWGKATKN